MRAVMYGLVAVGGDALVEPGELVSLGFRDPALVGQDSVPRANVKSAAYELAPDVVDRVLLLAVEPARRGRDEEL